MGSPVDMMNEMFGMLQISIAKDQELKLETEKKDESHEKFKEAVSQAFEDLKLQCALLTHNKLALETKIVVLSQAYTDNVEANEQMVSRLEAEYKANESRYQTALAEMLARSKSLHELSDQLPGILQQDAEISRKRQEQLSVIQSTQSIRNGEALNAHMQHLLHQAQKR